MTTLLTIVYCVLELFNLRAYMYQYSIHKFAVSLGMGAEKEDKLYPPKYRCYMLMGKINWIVIAALAFYSWQTALIVFGIGWILGVVLPSNHIDNLKILRDYLWKDANLRHEFMILIFSIDKILDGKDNI